MILPATALAAILSLTTLPFALQAEVGPVDQRAEVLVETPSIAPSVEEVAQPATPTSETEPPIEDIPAERIDTAPAPGLPVATPSDAEIDLPEPVRAEPETIEGADRTTLLAEVSAALSAVTTAQGRFTQIAPDQSISNGDFYLRRPGRVRFEYDDPVPIRIVADGATVAIEDRDLETQDRVPLRATPLFFLLSEQLDFEEEAEILNVRRANGFVAVAMEDRSGETEGVLEIILQDETFDLLSWRTEDAAGGLTTVTLQDVETGVRINPRQFRIEELGDEDERD